MLNANFNNFFMTTECKQLLHWKCCGSNVDCVFTTLITLKNSSHPQTFSFWFTWSLAKFQFPPRRRANRGDGFVLSAAPTQSKVGSNGVLPLSTLCLGKNKILPLWPTIWEMLWTEEAFLRVIYVGAIHSIHYFRNTFTVKVVWIQ